MASAPPLNASQRRHLAAQRAEAERLAAAGGHVIEWLGTWSDSSDGGTTLYRSQDGWCYGGGRSHLWAAISVANDDIIWRFGRPTDRCPA